MKSPTHALESQLEYNYTTRAQLTNSQVTKNSPKLKPTQATQVTECMPAARVLVCEVCVALQSVQCIPLLGAERVMPPHAVVRRCATQSAVLCVTQYYRCTLLTREALCVS